MIADSIVISAMIYGALSAATLPLGAAIGVSWRPTDRILSVLIAFGGGALLAALTIDLIAPGVERGYFPELAVGAICGGFLFKLLDHLVNRQGGYLRKTSTAITYWRRQARSQLRDVLSNLQRNMPLGELSDEAEDQLLSIMRVRDVPAGVCLYRAGDPSNSLYIIDRGSVELRDQRRGGETFETLQRYDSFGRMSFRAGLPRATEAYTATDTRLLVIPRAAFMALASQSAEFLGIVQRWLRDADFVTYLREQHGMSAEEITTWQAQALAELAEYGDCAPPIQAVDIDEDLVPMLAAEERLGFFSSLSEDLLQAIATQLVHKSLTGGYNFFHQGEDADRLYLLRKGTVYLVDPNDRQREPTIIRAGESFGGLSFLTEGNHAATAFGRGGTEVSMLRRSDFESLLEASGELRRQLGKFLQRSQISDYVTQKHNLDAQKAARWADQATRSLHGGKMFPSLAEMTRQVEGHAGAAMAVFLGIMLDGIPESLVIGANVLSGGTVSLALLAGVFLANFPEALSSAAGMKEQGIGVPRIIGMWSGLMIMTGLGAGLGALVLEGANHAVIAAIEGLAAGAMLTVVAETMLPEAFHKGGGVVGISTLAGFLATVSFSTIG